MQTIIAQGNKKVRAKQYGMSGNLKQTYFLRIKEWVFKHAVKVKFHHGPRLET